MAVDRQAEGLLKTDSVSGSACLNDMVTRRLRIFLSIDIVVLVLIGLAGSTEYSGPDVIKIMPSHGLHLLDFFVMGIGGLGVLGLWWSEIPLLRRESEPEPVDQEGERSRRPA